MSPIFIPPYEEIKFNFIICRVKGGKELLSKKKLIQKACHISGLKKTAMMEAYNAIWEVIADALVNGDEVSIEHFGKFLLRDTGGRYRLKYPDGNTNELIFVPPHYRIGFKPVPSLRRTVADLPLKEDSEYFEEYEEWDKM